ncbi:hypothetical protein MBOE_54290 [Mycolicibacterium boenickei]|uniref:Uncharacterized protein n=1 Tax=Mycolicibacterium boenickei TaxID=146017 RepID=A0ABM7J3L4_9MYCO|nr:hypothetical protein MBOE_54290 [Mycolicibacterium boenickei]
MIEQQIVEGFASEAGDVADQRRIGEGDVVDDVDRWCSHGGGPIRGGSAGAADDCVQIPPGVPCFASVTA